ncbi:MAG: lysylphosphatidylglycerol synthase transmembrane domain-containing protein [Steroidobacteraceae bacterium]
MSRALKVIVSLAFLAVLAWWADWSRLPEHLSRVQLSVASLVLLAYAVQLFISAWKWQWSLILHDLHLPYRLLARVYWIAFFLNNLLPTSIGGDAYRVYRTMPSDGFRSRALSAVIVERLIGLGALLIFGICGAWVLASELAFARAFLGVCLAGVAATVVLIAALRSTTLRPRIVRLMRHPWLAAVEHNVGLLLRARAAYAPLIAISLLFQAQAIGINYLLFAGTGEPVSLAKCALITAMAGVATVIPFSINGIGILEGAFAGTAIALGVNYEHALVVALLIRVLVLPLSAISGVLYACEPEESHLPALKKQSGAIALDGETADQRVGIGSQPLAGGTSVRH